MRKPHSVHPFSSGDGVDGPAPDGDAQKSKNQYYNDDVADLESRASSSLNSDHNISDDEGEDGDNQNLSPGSRRSRKSGKKKSTKSAFLRQKAEIKERILQEVMTAVMPDIGAYDIDGMIQSRPDQEKNRIVRWMEIVGIFALDLHEAVLTGSLSQVERSIRRIFTGKKANPLMINQYDEQGRTPLSLAVKIRNDKIVELLLRKRALPDIADENDGRTPLMYSVMQGTHEISKHLISSSAAIDQADFQCVTPLMIAASLNDLLHVRMLCVRLAEVDAVDLNGWTPLHYAAFGNALNCCHHLLIEGADRSKRDMNKRKPIDISKFKEHGEITALLSTFKI